MITEADGEYEADDYWPDRANEDSGFKCIFDDDEWATLKGLQSGIFISALFLNLPSLVYIDIFISYIHISNFAYSTIGIYTRRRTTKTLYIFIVVQLSVCTHVPPKITCQVYRI